MVLPPEREERRGGGVDARCRIQLDKVIALSAEGPNNVARLAIDQDDGMRVSQGDEVVAGFGLLVGAVLAGGSLFIIMGDGS